VDTRQFLRTKIIGLSARLRRLRKVDNAFVGLRPQDMPFAPSPQHFEAANARLANVEQEIRKRFEYLERSWPGNPQHRVLVDIALVERELDRARRLFGMFYEVFAQRGTSYGPSLGAHDAIAADCYAAVRQAAPHVFSGPLLKPVCYMEHGYSPATMRRGVKMSRLLGEENPFPLIRIPWDRDQPWQSVFLHEVAHNLQADLGIWQENRRAVVRRALQYGRHPLIASVYGRWHKEIFADLAAILLGGPAAAWGMADFLAQPRPRTLTYRPGSAHPTAYLRVMILAEMLRRIGFSREAGRISRVWQTLYRPDGRHRIPLPLLSTAGRVIPHIVDEIAFQTRRNLAQRGLADIMVFGRDDQRAILEGSRQLVAGEDRAVDLPPRYLVSAAHYALGSGKVEPRSLAVRVTDLLNRWQGVSAPSESAARENGPRIARRAQPLRLAA
jgi:hypothetical protein